MADYIKRDSVLELAREYYTQGLKEEAVPIRAIKNIPSADVHPVVHGKWVHLGGSDWCCSACGNVICTEGSWEHPLERGYSYCKHCGARMGGGT